MVKKWDKETCFGNFSEWYDHCDHCGKRTRQYCSAWNRSLLNYNKRWKKTILAIMSISLGFWVTATGVALTINLIMAINCIAGLVLTIVTLQKQYELRERVKAFINYKKGIDFLQPRKRRNYTIRS